MPTLNDPGSTWGMIGEDGTVYAISLLPRTPSTPVDMEVLLSYQDGYKPYGMLAQRLGMPLALSQLAKDRGGLWVYLGQVSDELRAILGSADLTRAMIRLALAMDPAAPVQAWVSPHAGSEALLGEEHFYTRQMPSGRWLSVCEEVSVVARRRVVSAGGSLRWLDGSIRVHEARAILGTVSGRRALLALIGGSEGA